MIHQSLFTGLTGFETLRPLQLVQELHIAISKFCIYWLPIKHKVKGGFMLFPLDRLVKFAKKNGHLPIIFLWWEPIFCIFKIVIVKSTMWMYSNIHLSPKFEASDTLFCNFKILGPNNADVFQYWFGHKICSIYSILWGEVNQTSLGGIRFHVALISSIGEYQFQKDLLT